MSPAGGAAATIDEHRRSYSHPTFSCVSVRVCVCVCMCVYVPSSSEHSGTWGEDRLPTCYPFMFLVGTMDERDRWHIYLGVYAG